MTSLKNYHTFGFDDARTSNLIILREEADLKAARNLYVTGGLKDFYILGGGSNTLFANGNIAVVLLMANKGIILNDNLLHVAAGEIWDDVVKFATEHNFWGIENLAGIPGCVGGAAVQNIGAYGSEFKDVVNSVEVFDLESGKMFTLSCEDCEYAYRSSIFKRKKNLIVWSATLSLSSKTTSTESSADVAKKIIKQRKEKLPNLNIYGSAGSFFKNPFVSVQKYKKLKEEDSNLNGFATGDKVKLHAGYLIDKCGWKGYREGSVGVYEKNALVLIHDLQKEGSGREILSLSDKIIQSVKEKYGIILEPEVVIV